MLFDDLTTYHSAARGMRSLLLVGIIALTSTSLLTACTVDDEPIEQTAVQTSRAWQPAHLPQPISRRAGFGEGLTESPTSQTTAKNSDDEATSPRPVSEPSAQTPAYTPPAAAVPAYTPPAHTPQPAPLPTPQPTPRPAPQPAPAPAPAPDPAPKSPAKQGPVLKIPGSDLPDFRLVMP